MSLFTKTRSQVQQQLGDKSMAAKNPLRQIANSNRNQSQIRAAQQILNNNTMSQRFNNLGDANDFYNDEMHVNASSNSKSIGMRQRSV